MMYDTEDYMEKLIAQKGLSQILSDLHKEVENLAHNYNTRSLWLIEQDLQVCLEEAKMWEE